MKRLEGWALVTMKRGTFVTKEMVKNPDLYIQNIRFVGNLIDLNDGTQIDKFKTNRVLSWQDNHVITESEEFILGESSKEYTEFAEAVANGIPIVINWVIGKNNMLFANLYENGTVVYLQERVVGQNFSKRTLLLESGKNVYVVWKNINRDMRKHLSVGNKNRDLRYLFIERNGIIQMDVLETSRKIWEYYSAPYEWIINSPNNFSILNEDIRNRRMNLEIK